MENSIAVINSLYDRLRATFKMNMDLNITRTVLNSVDCKTTISTLCEYPLYFTVSVISVLIQSLDIIV